MCALNTMHSSRCRAAVGEFEIDHQPVSVLLALAGDRRRQRREPVEDTGSLPAPGRLRAALGVAKVLRGLHRRDHVCTVNVALANGSSGSTGTVLLCRDDRSARTSTEDLGALAAFLASCCRGRVADAP